MTIIDSKTIAALRSINQGALDVTIGFRRGGSMIAPQPIQIGKHIQTRGATHQSSSPGARGQQQAAVVRGAPDLDVKIDDRFTLDGCVFVIEFVRRDPRIATICQCRMEG